MANATGNGGVVKVGTNQVAEVISSSLDHEAVIIPDMVQGDTFETHKVGSQKFSGSVSALWDIADTTGQEAMTVGASVVLHLMLSGVATGDIDFNGTVTITSINRSSEQDAMVPVSFTFTGNGALTRSILA